ncbi:MAG: 16S rRNA processing protein RimM [Bacteroidales bacterium]|nr:16S rRNA processing protein RimM [Bacteroidales bacterium]
MGAGAERGSRLSANSGKLENPIAVAHIVKSYNTNGEIVVKLANDLLEDLERKEPVFIYFDELPVPFFIEKFSTKGNSGAVIKFDNINDLAHSEELVKRKIFIEASSATSEALEELAQEDMGAYLSGFVLFDENGTEIGRVTDYYDYPNNPCIEIEPAEGVRSSLSDSEDDNSPILIPFQEQFIIAFDPEQRKIQMEVPSGLIVF